MEWTDFEKRFLDHMTPDDKDYRSKTYEAFRRIVPKLPDAAFPSGLCIHAPSILDSGEVWSMENLQMVVYFAPHIEQYPQARVDFVVAHEFAHVVRGSASRPTDTLEQERQDEEETDSLAESWGIAKPPACKQCGQFYPARSGWPNPDVSAGQ